MGKRIIEHKIIEQKMDWTLVLAIIATTTAPVVGLWHVVSNDMNVSREDMRERANKYDAELMESRKLWASTMQEIKALEKERHALEQERIKIQKKCQGQN